MSDDFTIQYLNRFQDPAKPTAAKPVAQMGSVEKLSEALRRSTRFMGAALVDQLKQILSSWLTLVVLAALVAAVVASGGAAGAVIAMVVSRAVSVGFSAAAVYRFFSAGAKATNARNDAELEVAAREFAQAIVEAGAALLPVIAKGGLRGVSAARNAAARWGGEAAAENRFNGLSRRALEKAAEERAKMVANYQYKVPPPAKAGEVVEIKIGELHSRQNQVDLGGAFPTYSEANLPTVYWVDWVPGKKPFWALSDGNHRTASRYLAGHETIKAKVEVLPQQMAENSLFGMDRPTYIPFPKNDAWHAFTERYLGPLENLRGQTDFNH